MNGREAEESGLRLNAWIAQDRPFLYSSRKFAKSIPLPARSRSDSTFADVPVALVNLELNGPNRSDYPLLGQDLKRKV